MSLTLEAAEAAEPEPWPEPPGAPEQAAAEPPAPHRPGTWTTGVALTVLGALLLGYPSADVWVVGSLRHNRDQQVEYAALRYALANASAPVGPLDINGQVVRLGTPVALLDVPELGLRSGRRRGHLLVGAHVRTRPPARHRAPRPSRNQRHHGPAPAVRRPVPLPRPACAPRTRSS